MRFLGGITEFNNALMSEMNLGSFRAGYLLVLNFLYGFKSETNANDLPFLSLNNANLTQCS